MVTTKKVPARTRTRDIDVLRARALAAALADARPQDLLTNDVARNTWYDAVRYVAAVVCSKEGVSLDTFCDLCGVPD